MSAALRRHPGNTKTELQLIGRQQYGWIAIANSDLAAAAMVEAAIK